MRVFLVCLISAVAAEESFSALGFAKIHESLNALELKGTTRMSGLAQGHKMLVERFLQDAAASGQLRPRDTQILNDKVIPLLNNLISYMANEKQEDDILLSGKHHAYTQCETRVQSDLDAKIAAEAAVGVLVTCRLAEAVKFGDDALRCGDVDSFLSLVASHMSPHCVYPDKNGDGTWDRDDIDPFGSRLSQGLAHVQSQRGLFNTKNGLCTAAATALHTQHELCEADDVDLQNKYCQWTSIRNSKCDEQHDCHVDAKSEYNSTYDALLPKAISRVLDARNMYFVKCLVTALISANQTDFDGWTTACTTETNNRGDAYYNENYGITYEAEPAEQACDKDEPHPVPGDATWVQTRYTDGCNSHPNDPGFTHCNTVMKSSVDACP